MLNKLLWCMMDEMVTGVGRRVSQSEVIFAAMVSGSSEVLFVPICTITSETLRHHMTYMTILV